MTRLDQIKKMLGVKERKKEVRDDEFTAKDGRFNYVVRSIFPKSTLTTFFNAMRSKVQGVKQDFDVLALDTWELDADTLLKFENKIINEICTFKEIIAQVKQDMPSFALVSNKVDYMRFTKIDDFSYRVEISLTGACSGD